MTVHNFDYQYNDVDDVVALCAALNSLVSTQSRRIIFRQGLGHLGKLPIGDKVFGIVF